MYIELLEYWKGGEWEVAQHLKGISPKETLKMVKDSGLTIYCALRYVESPLSSEP